MPTVAPSRAHYGDMMAEHLGACENERDALRAALVSLVDGKSEFDIEYDTGMPADERAASWIWRTTASDARRHNAPKPATNAVATFYSAKGR